MKNIYQNVRRVQVSRQAVEQLPPHRVSTSTRVSTKENYAAACKFFRKPTKRAIRRALAERDATYYSPQLRQLVNAPIDPVSDEEIAQFVATLHAARKVTEKPTRGTIRVVGMTPDRALQIAMQALESSDQ